MWIVLRLPTANGRMALLLSLDAGSGACLARIDCQLAMFEGIFPRESWTVFIDSKDEEFVERTFVTFERVFPRAFRCFPDEVFQV